MPDSRYMLLAVEYMAYFFIFVAGLIVMAVIITFIVDVTQRKQAIRRNYPVVAHFRYAFESLGKFFRQYFFAMDREEMPFNRAERSWVYQASKDLDTTRAFGSTRSLREPGTLLFVNCPFPVLGEDAAQPEALSIGPYCRQPYTTSSLFNISGMSFGAISKPAVLALANGARAAGCWMNTGEGGLSPLHLEGGCDLVFQIGTAKYGVCNAAGLFDDDRLRKVAAHERVRMFEIKLSQGAKPGKGGILPGAKVTEEIAAIRGIPVGKDSISPNRHIEVDNIEQLLDMIQHVREVTHKPVGIKMVLGAYGWLDELCELIHARGKESAPDFITIDSADGGSGAAPMSLLDYMGLPLKESLPMLVRCLERHHLKERIRVIASGKLITPAEAAWALCVGADFITSARGFMFSLGCIQALQCNKNTCPTGITTHNPRLQKGLDPRVKAVRVENYVRNIVHEIGVIAHSCGVHEPRELRPFHARVVIDNGHSISLEELYQDR
ncbi:FMN-binding glutamate synthase family protein [Sulfuriflexus mobilis]|uniref:FMN-binding glutamate synthase family protein n=1 Tax=Sulfuriflexus mobilis TaxID=1811807 RepID=UPI000F83443F|nr:FMN-binding glutamate synthase family protein [Sulfuriflexus mobilis]